MGHLYDISTGNLDKQHLHTIHDSNYHPILYSYPVTVPVPPMIIVMYLDIPRPSKYLYKMSTKIMGQNTMICGYLEVYLRCISTGSMVRSHDPILL